MGQTNDPNSPMVLIHKDGKLWAATPSADGYKFEGLAYKGGDGEFHMKSAFGGQDPIIHVSKGFVSTPDGLMERALPGYQYNDSYAAVKSGDTAVAMAPRADGKFDPVGEMYFKDGQFHLKSLPGFNDPVISVKEAYESVPTGNGESALEPRALPQGYRPSHNNNNSFVPDANSSTGSTTASPSAATPKAELNVIKSEKFSFDAEGNLIDNEGYVLPKPRVAEQLSKNSFKATDGSVWVGQGDGTALRFQNEADANMHASLNGRFAPGASAAPTVRNPELDAVKGDIASTDFLPNHDDVLDDIQGVDRTVKSINDRNQNGILNVDPSKATMPGTGNKMPINSAAINAQSAEVSRLEGNISNFTRWRDNAAQNGDQAMASEFQASINREQGLLTKAKQDLARLQSGAGATGISGKKPGLLASMKANKMGTFMTAMSGMGLGIAGYQMGAGNGGVMGALGMLQTLPQFIDLAQRTLHVSNGNAILMAAVIVGISAAFGAIKKKGKIEEQGYDKYDPQKMPNTGQSQTNQSGQGSQGSGTGSTPAPTTSEPQTWDDRLPSKNVFTIGSAVAALALGSLSLNLQSNNLAQEGFTFKPAELPAFTKQLEKATGEKIKGNPANAIFIQKGTGHSGSDKVVYLTQEHAGTYTDGVPDMVYRTNMVSINPGGYVLGDPLAMHSFFLVDPQTKNIVPTMSAAQAIAKQTALAKAAAAGSGVGAVGAAWQGAMEGHQVSN
jgi:hypothetical protein